VSSLATLIWNLRVRIAMLILPTPRFVEFRGERLDAFEPNFDSQCGDPDCLCRDGFVFIAPDGPGEQS
jgi:hypothetical protein